MKYGVPILLLVALCATTRADEDTKDVMRETLPAYTVVSNADTLNATRCRKELEVFRDAVDRRILWAIKMLDSSGNPGPGFAYGNNYWFGQRRQCQLLTNKLPLQLNKHILQNNSRFRRPDEEFPPFDPYYFVARFAHNGTLQYHIRVPLEDIVILGLCLPASCSTNEVGTILEKIFQDRTLLVGQLYSMDFKLVEVKDLRDDHQWLRSGSSIFIISIIAINLILVIVGTLYDVLVFQKRLETKKKFVACDNNNTADGKHDQINEDVTLSALKPESRIGMMIMCFSIYTNSKSIFSTKLSPDSVPVLHGIKFFGMFWIIMVHTVFYGYAYVDNRADILSMSRDFSAQLISNATFSVDTFFVMSGFLMTYVYLMNQKSKNAPISIGKNANTFFLLILKRFIRLTPSYMMVIALAILNFSWYRYVSPFAIPENPAEICMKYWWRNMMYINNFFDRETMCLSWSWFLSCEMQFFIYGTFVLLLSSMYFYSAVFIGIFTVIGSMLISGYVTYATKYIPTVDEVYLTLSVMYDPPWHRITPYIIGIATAYLLRKMNNELHLKKRTLVLCWCFGIVCNCTILFGLIDRHIPLSSSILYLAFSKTGWGLGIAWLIIACCTNNAGVICKFLEFKGWIPLSKLTYSAYLLNPFLINSVYLHSDLSFRVEFLNSSVFFMGLLACTYICGYVLTLCVETPCIRLLKLFLNPNSKSK